MTAIVCLALSAAAVVIAVLRGTRGRFRSALRWAAVALVPTGLYLTGLITVFDRIGRALGDWAAHLVFDPKVWTGVVMLGAAALLLLATGIRRGRALKPSEPAAEAKGRTAPPAVKGRTAPPAVAAKKPYREDDFSDIEEILKRRGL
ncbi:hypothetical protein [Streptacidiphilus cavernicola]|uniref:Cellulose synthase n=1 Tax=Streptacidiphilus cavernicola TaxID=3342716 RepID=A0ABV6VQE4_9ACTN